MRRQVNTANESCARMYVSQAHCDERIKLRHVVNQLYFYLHALLLSRFRITRINKTVRLSVNKRFSDAAMKRELRAHLVFNCLKFLRKYRIVTFHSSRESHFKVLNLFFLGTYSCFTVKQKKSSLCNT